MVNITIHTRGNANTIEIDDAAADASAATAGSHCSANATASASQSADGVENQKLYDQLKQELYRRELSNSENFDKAVLAYSAGGLGLSLSFIKEIVPLEKAVYIQVLYGSWLFFVLAIILVISSFIVSQRGIKRQLEIAERYYLRDDDDALSEKNGYAAATERLNSVAGFFFIIAIVFTTLFVVVNVKTNLVPATDVSAVDSKEAQKSLKGKK